MTFISFARVGAHKSSPVFTCWNNDDVISANKHVTSTHARSNKIKAGQWRAPSGSQGNAAAAELYWLYTRRSLYPTAILWHEKTWMQETMSSVTVESSALWSGEAWSSHRLTVVHCRLVGCRRLYRYHVCKFRVSRNIPCPKGMCSWSLCVSKTW